MRRRGIVALAGAAAGIGIGYAAERFVVRSRRERDFERLENFGERRGERARKLDLPDGARLFVEEVGPESPRGAVFVHGSALRTDMWHYQLAGLGDHRLVFYDLRGHGLSQPKGDADFSIVTLTRDLAAVIEDAELEEVVVVGHSIGGMIALELCRLRSDWLGSKLKGLALINTTYRPAAETLAGGAALARLERVIRRPLDTLGKQSPRIDQLRKIIKPSDAAFWTVSLAAFGQKASAKQVDFTYDMLAETPSDVIFDLIKSYRDFDVRSHLDAITIPALVVAGENDRITVAEASRHIAQHLPKAELRVFDGCGHMPMMERHEAFNALLQRFLDDVLGPPGIPPGRD